MLFLAQVTDNKSKLDNHKNRFNLRILKEAEIEIQGSYVGPWSRVENTAVLTTPSLSWQHSRTTHVHMKINDRQSTFNSF